jgi:hypothetical protein
MDIREQVMADDVRREFRAGDLDVLMAVLRAEGAGDDAGGGLVAGGGKPLDMQTRIGGGYPYGPEYPFGISIAGDIVTVYETVVYRGGMAHVIEQQELKITADNDYLAMQCIPGDTPAKDVFSIILWPNDDGVPQDATTPIEAIYRAIHQFHLETVMVGEDEVKTASWLRALWRSCDLGTMGY